MPLFWHGQLVVLVLQIYIHRILVYSWNDTGKLCIRISLLVVYCIIFRCYVFKCNSNLWYFCVIFIHLYSVYSCNLMHCCNIQWNVLLYAFCCGLFSNYPTLSFTGKLRVFKVGIRALVYKAQRTRHIRTIRKNSSDIGLVISN